MINVMFLGNQLPFRLGEVARGVLATRRGVPLVVTSGTSIVVERLIDVLMLSLLIAATVSRMPRRSRRNSRIKGIALFGAARPGSVSLTLLVFRACARSAAHRSAEQLLRAALATAKRLPLRRMMLESSA